MSALRASLIALGPTGQVAGSFVFPYMPETIERELTRGPAGLVEAFTIAFELDATDAIAEGDETVTEFGLHPQLAQLQHLLAQDWLLLEVGPNRNTPIQLLGASVIESSFDASLNPRRAHVTLRAQTVTSSNEPVLAKRVGDTQGAAVRLAALAVSGA